MREASDSSAPCSPPSRCTTHSPTLSQRTPRAASGTWSRSQRYFDTVRSARERQPGGGAEAGDLLVDPPRLLLAARVVPGDRGHHRLAVAAEQHAGLGHARHAEADDRASATSASASRAAASAQSTNPSGAISAPVGTGVQTIGAWPCAISSPSGVTTAALHDVVPRSSPRSSSRTGSCRAAGARGAPRAAISRTACTSESWFSARLSLVIETDSVPIFFVVGLPVSAL